MDNVQNRDSYISHVATKFEMSLLYFNAYSFYGKKIDSFYVEFN
jgi:hypothetical protein